MEKKKGITKAELFDNAVEHAASEVYQWWTNAAGDIGYDFDPNLYGTTSKLKKIYNRLKREGLDKYALQDAMADYIFDDEDSISDCCGDRIHDEATQIKSNPAGFAKDMFHDEIMIAICKKMIKKCNGESIKNSMNKMIAEHEKWLVKAKERANA